MRLACVGVVAIGLRPGGGAVAARRPGIGAVGPEQAAHDVVDVVVPERRGRRVGPPGEGPHVAPGERPKDRADPAEAAVVAVEVAGVPIVVPERVVIPAADVHRLMPVVPVVGEIVMAVIATVLGVTVIVGGAVARVVGAMVVGVVADIVGPMVIGAAVVV